SSSTVLASSFNPSVFGASVTFTATVSAVSPGAGTPTGTVTFKDSATTLGTGTLTGGQATFLTSSLSVSNHSITAVYNSDVNFTNSTSSVLTQTVTKADTTTSLASSFNPSVFGASVTFTAMVSAVSPGGGTPTGSVIFKDGATTLGTGALASARATLTSPTLATGSQTNSAATHSGDGNFDLSSTSTSFIQTVNREPTTTTVSSSQNPSVFGQSVTFTATVTDMMTGIPTGTVIFKDGATALSTNTLDGAGQAM